MDIAETKLVLQTRKSTLQAELNAVQVCLDTLDENTQLTFPNLEEVVTQKEEALSKVIEKDEEIERLKDLIPDEVVTDESNEDVNPE